MRKKIIIFIFLLSCCIYRSVFSYEMFISGIYQKGSYRNEPKPAEGEYLKVRSAGFQISGEWAVYKFYADITAWLREPFLVRVEYENPLNPDKPFIQESLIDPAPGVVDLTSPYIEGLEVKKDYYIKVTLYASKSKDKILDQLTQHVRSYIDSRSRPIKFWGGIRKRKY